MITRVLWRCAILASVLMLFVSASLAAETAKTNIEWRVIGAFSNAAPLQTVGCYVGEQDKTILCVPDQAKQELYISELATEPVCIALDDWGIACPSFFGPVETKPGQTTLFDFPVNLLYQADNLSMGMSYKDMGQTFVATGKELDRVSCMPANAWGTFKMTLRKNGPDGEQVGPVALFTTTEARQWGTARWDAGAAPLEPGKTYYIGIRHSTKARFTVCMHSTGDIYPNGCAYFDGVAAPESDLGLLIAQQRDDAVRSAVLYSTKADGWVLHTKGVYFKARSANIRAVYARMKFKNMPESIEATFKVYKLMTDTSITKLGPDKTCASTATKDGEHYLAAVYNPSEMLLEPGQMYYVEVIPKGEGVSADETQIPKRDLLISIYGETIPGDTPTIYNLKTAEINRTLIKLKWEGTRGSVTRVQYGISPYNLNFSIDVPKGKQEIAISPIRPATTFNFRVVATSTSGSVFQTPIYQARTLDADYKPVTQPPLQAVPCEGFLSLAPMVYIFQPVMPQVIEAREMPLQNPDFEDGLNGWLRNESQETTSVPIAKFGKLSAGWNTQRATDAEHYSPIANTFFQTVDVTPGKSYLLSAYVMTDQSEGSDVQVRLLCDYTGGMYFADQNSTQWLRTGGQWIQIGKVWKASSNRMTVGIGFARRRDWKQVTALVDGIRLVEIKNKEK